MNRRAAVAVAAVALAVAACSAQSGATDAPIAGADSSVAVAGRDNLAWDTEELTAEPGLVEVALSCDGRVNHNFVIDETRTEVVACRPGETRRGAVELGPGDYTFVCTVPGHDQTMRGLLTVG